MQAFGYLSQDQQAQTPSELHELTLVLSLDEIYVLLRFLQDTKARFENVTPVMGISHSHLQDSWTGWSPSEPDLVIVYNEKP